MSNFSAIDLLFWSLNAGLLYCVLLTICQVAIRARRFCKDNRWCGYRLTAMGAVTKRFIDGPPHRLTVKIRPIRPQSIWLPIAGEFGPSDDTITIDPRIVRNDRDLIQTLLHEICHFNQSNQGRLRLGLAGCYLFQPVEREARAFAKAWFKVAYRIYKKELAKKPTS